MSRLDMLWLIAAVLAGVAAAALGIALRAEKRMTEAEERLLTVEWYSIATMCSMHGNCPRHMPPVVSPPAVWHFQP